MGKYITFQTNPSLIFMYQKLSENPWLIWPSLRLHPCSWRSLTISEAHLQLILPLRGANGRRGKLTVKRNLREFLYHTSKHGAHHEDMKACSMSHVQEYNLILWLSFCLAHWWIKQRIHNQLEHQILESDYDHYNCNRYQLDVTNPHVVSKHIRFLIGAVSEKVNTNLNSRKRCVKYIREHISAGRLNSTMMPGVPHRIASGNACAGQGMSLHRERDAIWLTIPLHQEPVIEQDFTTTSRSLTVTNMIQLLHLLFCMSNFTLTRKANPSGYRKGPTTLCPNLSCPLQPSWPLSIAWPISRAQSLAKRCVSQDPIPSKLALEPRRELDSPGTKRSDMARWTATPSERKREIIICNDTHTDIYIEREWVCICKYLIIFIQ